MKDFQELINKRRSIRKFTDQLLTPEQVELILKAGLKSPSSKGKTPWYFLVVEDKEALKTLSKCKSSAKLIEGCALAIVVLADPIVSDVWIEDASIASIMMQLQAEDLGLGSCWVQIRNRFTPSDTECEQYVRDMFDIPYQIEVLSVIAFGYKAQERPPFDEDKLQWEKVRIGKF